MPMNTIYIKEQDVSRKETNLKFNERNINSSLNEKRIKIKETAEYRIHFISSKKKPNTLRNYISNARY